MTGCISEKKRKRLRIFFGDFLRTINSSPAIAQPTEGAGSRSLPASQAIAAAGSQSLITNHFSPFTFPALTSHVS
jgi:hypothetical protein